MQLCGSGSRPKKHIYNITVTHGNVLALDSALLILGFALSSEKNTPTLTATITAYAMTVTRRECICCRSFFSSGKLHF